MSCQSNLSPETSQKPSFQHHFSIISRAPKWEKKDQRGSRHPQLQAQALRCIDLGLLSTLGAFVNHGQIPIFDHESTTKYHIKLDVYIYI